MRFQFWYQRDRRYNISSVKYWGFQNLYHDTRMIPILESWFQWDSNFDIRGTEGITYLRSSTGDSKTCIMTPEWYTNDWNHDSNEIPILISEGQKVWHIFGQVLGIPKLISWHQNDTNIGIMIPMRFQFWYQRDRRYDISSVKYWGFQNLYHDTRMIPILESWFQWDSNFDIRGTEGITYLRPTVKVQFSVLWFQLWKRDSKLIPFLGSWIHQDCNVGTSVWATAKSLSFITVIPILESWFETDTIFGILNPSRLQCWDKCMGQPRRV